MQEIAERLDQMEKRLLARMERIEKVLEDWARTLSGASQKEKNAVRRQQYREAKRRREEGLVSLPEKHVLKFRDMRLKPKVQGWAEVGMRFGRADKPGQFFTWFVHQWNNCSYLKKPITFSGSSFRVWGSHVRYSYGPRDLMGFAERRGSLQILRNRREGRLRAAPVVGLELRRALPGLPGNAAPGVRRAARTLPEVREAHAGRVRRLGGLHRRLLGRERVPREHQPDAPARGHRPAAHVEGMLHGTAGERSNFSRTASARASGNFSSSSVISPVPYTW